MTSYFWRRCVEAACDIGLRREEVKHIDRQVVVHTARFIDDHGLLIAQVSMEDGVTMEHNFERDCMKAYRALIDYASWK